MTDTKRISARQAREIMQKYPNVIILDVRTKREYDNGHIPGAVLISDFEIENKAKKILHDCNALILVYCQSGARSRTATNMLVKMGYTKVYDFGGINTWPYECE